MNNLINAQRELLIIAQTWPTEHGFCSFRYFGQTKCADATVFKDDAVVKSFRLSNGEQDPASIPAQLREFLAKQQAG